MLSGMVFFFKKAIESFKKARAADLVNEKMPEINTDKKK